MATPKKYFHDHFVLLLLSINTSIAFLAIIFILLRLSAGQGNGYFVQYRANLGVNAFKNGSVLEILSFIAFTLLVLVVHTILSMRTYHINRQLSTTILAMGILLSVLSIIVSNALLALH